MRHRFWLVTLSGLTIVAGFLLLAPPPAAGQQMQMQMMAPGQAELIRGLLPSAVNITSFVADTASAGTMNAASAPSNQSPSHPKSLRGSGFVIDPSGVILTNFHVVDGAYDVHVMFSDGVLVPGRILAIAPRNDLALVKVDTQHALAMVRGLTATRCRSATRSSPSATRSASASRSPPASSAR
jgi:S1-C subfamily serine protease